jgi:hypothetical protein
VRDGEKWSDTSSRLHSETSVVTTRSPLRYCYQIRVVKPAVKTFRVVNFLLGFG